MKYVILLGDGMADWPHEAFGQRTVLEAASIPNLDSLARRGELGLVNTTTEGLPPGSDVTNLSIMGFDPRRYYTGRAPLEAASLGVTLGPDEIAFRCNLVTFRDGSTGELMDDYSAGHIKTEDARALIEHLDSVFAPEGFRFHTGKSYRHLCVTSGIDTGVRTWPPHDIMDQPVAPHRPSGDGAARLCEVMDRSRTLFADLVPNRRLDTPVTQIWLWGQGSAPTIPTLKERTGLRGAVVSAVDLLRGIGVYAGLQVIEVPGATGYLDTNYEGKVEAAVGFLDEGGDFVFVHLEAPDECGHNGVPADKLRAIEDFDARVVGPMTRYLESTGDYRLLVLPDHATPLAIRTHSRDPVPFVLGSSADTGRRQRGYSERSAKDTGVVVASGMDLFERLIGHSIPR